MIPSALHCHDSKFLTEDVYTSYRLIDNGKPFPEEDEWHIAVGAGRNCPRGQDTVQHADPPLTHPIITADDDTTNSIRFLQM